MNQQEKIIEFEYCISLVVKLDLEGDSNFITYLKEHDFYNKNKLLELSSKIQIMDFVMENKNKYLRKKGIEIITNNVEMQEFLKKLKDLESKVKRYKTIKVFFKFLKSLNLEKKFKYQEYNNHTKGVFYYSLELNKWIVFDTTIIKYIENKVPKNRQLHLQFDDKNYNVNINDIFNFIEKAKIERLSEDEKDELETDSDATFVQYNNRIMQLDDYYDNLYSYLVMVVFNQYKDCLSKNQIRIRMFF